MSLNEFHVQRLMTMADDSARAARISKLARGVEKATGDTFFGYLAYAVDTHQDGIRYSGFIGATPDDRERDGLVRAAFAQAVP